MIIPDKLTPLSRDEAASAIAAAYYELTGALPTASVLGLLLAQSALETGHWKKIHHYNFGNQKAAPGYPLITQFRCSEVIDGVEQFFDPPHPQCNFRAYETAAEGALDYLKVLKRRPHWWAGLHTGDPSAFVDALATPPRYFTANVAVYKRTLVSLFGQFGPLVRAVVERFRPAPPSPAPVPAAVVATSTAEVPASVSSPSSSPLPPLSAPPPSSPTAGDEKHEPSAIIPTPTPNLFIRILRVILRALFGARAR